ncbi:hypothetical protein PIB30_072418, partial [Stylosanthes scabra]|nr:hypothetical protein [Stylosanthes scabra]
DLIQEAIMEGRLKFEKVKSDMKVDSDPFEVNSNFVEPCCFEINMVGFHSFEFETSLGNFEQNIRQAATLFEKERMKKELSHKEEQVRQRNGPRRVDVTGSTSSNPAVMQWMQEVHGNQDRDFKEYNEYSNRRSFRGRGDRGRGRFGQNRGRGHFRPFGARFNNLSNKGSSEIIDKGGKSFSSGSSSVS